MLELRKLVAAGLCLILPGALLVSAFFSRPNFSESLAPAMLKVLEIAPREQALTFARYRAGGVYRVLLVHSYRGDSVRGVDLTQHFERPAADPVQLFREFGYDAIAQAASGAAVTVDVARLEIPFDGKDANIGIGANYLDHAREARIDEQPFVFPKLARLSRFDSTVSRKPSVRLDYEAEVGLVVLEDLTTSDVQPRTMGLVLCNELTDRWTLLRHYRFSEPMGTTGFIEGKSREGFSVVGPLLVIPRDLGAFYGQIELSLYVNGRLRQRDLSANMAWGPAEILAEILRRRDWTFRRYEGTERLLEADGRIPAGTVIFTGTPAGVIFKPHNVWNPWIYLRPGDEVAIRASALGVIRNAIAD